MEWAILMGKYSRRRAIQLSMAWIAGSAIHAAITQAETGETKPPDLAPPKHGNMMRRDLPLGRLPQGN